MTTTKLDVTLQRFDAQIDEFAGRTMGFADKVQQLALVRAQQNVINERRSVIFDVLKEIHEQGRPVAYDGKILRSTRPTPVVEKRTVPAAVIKKREPRMWNAARVLSPQVSVKTIGTQQDLIIARATAAVGFLPAVPTGRWADEAARAYAEVPSTSGLKAAEALIVADLREIAAVCNWDGQARAFSDGWTVQLNILRYNSDRLREIAPELWEKLAQTTMTGGTTRLYMGRAGDDFDDAEIDAE